MGVLDHAHGDGTLECFDVLLHAGVQPSNYIGEEDMSLEERIEQR
jgi:hypothetical protein